MGTKLYNAMWSELYKLHDSFVDSNILRDRTQNTEEVA